MNLIEREKLRLEREFRKQQNHSQTFFMRGRAGIERECWKQQNQVQTFFWEGGRAMKGSAGSNKIGIDSIR